MPYPPAAFDDARQSDILDELRVAAAHQGFRLHAVASDPTHVHVLVSWGDERGWKRMHGSIRQSICRRLMRYERRPWLVKCGSRKRVHTREHFQHLVTTYLPKHRGRQWFERG